MLVLLQQSRMSHQLYINKMGNYCENCSYDKKKGQEKMHVHLIVFIGILEEKKRIFFKNNQWQ